MNAVLNRAVRRWKRLPAGTRADFLAYLRDEASDFAEQAKGTDFLRDGVDPASLRRWSRANIALVEIAVAVAGEPKPRSNKKPKRPKRGRKSIRRMVTHKWIKVDGSSWLETCACGALRSLPTSGPCLYSTANSATWTQEEPPHDEHAAMRK